MSGTVNIHGKEYKTVALRVSEFRQAKPDWTITTDLISANDELVVMKAAILDETGRCIATGYAEEYRSASKINRTSALENCETSAIGRALAAAGLAGTEYASADEVAGAISQQQVDEALADQYNYMDVLRENLVSVYFIKEFLKHENWESAAESYCELSRDDLVTLWRAPSKGGVWTTEERKLLKSDEMNAAIKLFKQENNNE